MTKTRSSWERFWFAGEATSSLGLFRIVFGVLVFFWTLSLTPALYAFYSRSGVLPDPPHFTAAQDPGAWGILGIFGSNAAVTGVYFALLVGSLTLAAGFKTRMSAFVVWICLLSFVRRNPWVQNSGDLLLHVIAFYLLLAPAGAALSLDRWREARADFWTSPVRAVWAIRLLQVQLSAIYLGAVWAKVQGETWNNGTAVSYALRIADLQRLPVPGFLTDSVLVANVATYGTLAAELGLATLVWNRKLRPWILLVGVALHLGIDFAVRVGFFSFAMIALYLVFIPPETVDEWLRRLRRRWADVRAAGIRAAVLRPGVRRAASAKVGSGTQS